MNKSVATIYLIWAMFLIGVGAYIVHNILDTKNPASFGSKMKELEDAINEDSEVP